jgi:Peptidase family M23/IPT/TIG domain
MGRFNFPRFVGLLLALLAFAGATSVGGPAQAAPAAVDIRQNGSLKISGDLVEGSQVYIDIPIKNFGSSTSPHLHTYTEGYTAKGSLWRADGASPTAVALGSGQQATIRVKADLWAGHIGTWTTYGVYLWNDDSNSYISPLAANGYNQSLSFAVTLDIRQNSSVQVSGTMVEGNTAYFTLQVKNNSNTASPALHPYIEGTTGAGSLWRADGAQPASAVLQPGQTVTFRVQQDLWVGHAGTWNATGIYLWNNSVGGYYGPLVANGHDQHFSFNVNSLARLVQDGEITVSGSQTSGGVVLLSIPVRNVGGTASVAFHPYTEGQTGKGSLWRADGAQPPGIVLQPNQRQVFTVRHDLWPGHEGNWRTYGVYLWNDANETYLSPLAANGHNQQISFNVTAPQALSLRLPVSPVPGFSLTQYLWSFFDHQYPQLTAESPAVVTGTIVNWQNETKPGTHFVCDPGSSCYSGHDGLDFSYHVWYGEDILAAHAGTASGVIWDCAAHDQSIYVLQVDSGRYRTVYLHVQHDATWQSFHDYPRPVAAGDTIAHLGNTGWQNGCTSQKGGHLHFGVYYSQSGANYSPTVKADPLDVLDPMGFKAGQQDPWVHDMHGAVSRWLWAFRESGSADVAPGSLNTASVDDTVARADVSGAAVDAPATLNLVLASSPDAGRPALTPAGPYRPETLTVPVGAAFELSGDYAAGGALTAFQVGVPLTVAYTAAEAAYVAEPSLAAYRWDEAAHGWEPLASTVDSTNKVVTAVTDRPGTFCLRGSPLQGPPMVVGANPARVLPGVQTSLTITGSGFLPGAWVQFGTSGLQVTAVSPTQITALVSADWPAGSYALAVQNPDSQSASLPGAISIGYPLWLPAVER